MLKTNTKAYRKNACNYVYRLLKNDAQEEWEYYGNPGECNYFPFIANTFINQLESGHCPCDKYAIYSVPSIEYHIRSYGTFPFYDEDIVNACASFCCESDAEVQAYTKKYDKQSSDKTIRYFACIIMKAFDDLCKQNCFVIPSIYTAIPKDRY